MTRGAEVTTPPDPNPFIRPETLRPYLAWALFFWTALVAASAYVNVQGDRETTKAIATAEARAAFSKDLVYRRWASMHGGVYVPTTDTTPPNPYLQHVPDRDITTPSGLRLTLVNPAYMTRQVFTLWPDEYGTRGHITGLDPINPENAPDPWERRALQRFFEGETEVAEISLWNEVRHMRLMRPFRVESGCRHCHDEPLGSLRGGISTSVPMALYDDLFLVEARRTILFHIAIWLSGCTAVLVAARTLRRQVAAWARAGAAIQLSEAGMREAAAALSRSETRHRIVSENVSDLVNELDETGRILFVNDRVRDLLNREPEELLGRDCTVFIHPDDREETLAVLKDVIAHPGERRRHILRILGRDIDPIWIESTAVCLVQDGGTIRVYVASRDMTEQKRAQEALLASNRLAAVGSLAAGVAHEFNNLLTIQKNNASILVMDRERLGIADEAARYLNFIIESADRGADIVRSLGRIARPREPQRTTFDIVALLENLLHVQTAALTSCHVKVERRWAGAVAVNADRSQVEQILINLIQNALQSMIPAHGGTLTIAARSRGDSVRIEVADTGIGMDETTRARCFDPFFTTKGSHADDALGIPGTGLGLAISQKLALENGGVIEIASEKGRGTTVLLQLPAAVQAATPSEAEASAARSPSPAAAPEILLVEDEPLQRESLVRVLAHLGFPQVITCATGKEALEAARDRSPRIALLDYAMPEMNGMDLAMALRRTRPDLRIVIVTGNLDLAPDPEHRLDAIIHKPIDFEKLGACLRRLAKAAPGGGDSPDGAEDRT